MSEMVERVAKVITDSLVEDGAVNLLDSTDEEGECHFHSSALLAARAAISAMREPTLEMVGAARDQADCIGDIWRAMIDWALK